MVRLVAIVGREPLSLLYTGVSRIHRCVCMYALIVVYGTTWLVGQETPNAYSARPGFVSVEAVHH